MPIEPISPCCSAGGPDQLGTVNTEYDCGPGGDCPEYYQWDPRQLEDTYCMYKSFEPPKGRKCQCVSFGALPGRQETGWMFKYVLATIDPILPYLVRRTVASKFTPSWYPTDLSLVELRVLLRTVPTKRGTDYTYSVPSPIPSIPLTPFDKVTACNERCGSLVYQDFAHQTETRPEFKDRKSKCRFNCLQYFDV